MKVINKKIVDYYQHDIYKENLLNYLKKNHNFNPMMMGINPMNNINPMMMGMVNPMMIGMNPMGIMNPMNPMNMGNNMDMINNINMFPNNNPCMYNLNGIDNSQSKIIRLFYENEFITNVIISKNENKIKVYFVFIRKKNISTTK